MSEEMSKLPEYPATAILGFREWVALPHPGLWGGEEPQGLALYPIGGHANAGTPWHPTGANEAQCIRSDDGSPPHPDCVCGLHMLAGPPWPSDVSRPKVAGVVAGWGVVCEDRGCVAFTTQYARVLALFEPVRPAYLAKHVTTWWEVLRDDVRRFANRHGIPLLEPGSLDTEEQQREFLKDYDELVLLKDIKEVENDERTDKEKVRGNADKGAGNATGAARTAAARTQGGPKAPGPTGEKAGAISRVAWEWVARNYPDSLPMVALDGAVEEVSNPQTTVEYGVVKSIPSRSRRYVRLQTPGGNERRMEAFSDVQVDMLDTGERVVGFTGFVGDMLTPVVVVVVPRLSNYSGPSNGKRGTG